MTLDDLRCHKMTKDVKRWHMSTVNDNVMGESIGFTIQELGGYVYSWLCRYVCWNGWPMTSDSVKCVQTQGARTPIGVRKITNLETHMINLKP